MQSGVVTIERKLNEPSLCQLWLSLPSDGSLATPVRNQPLAVIGDDGSYYFTGYIAVTPLPEYAGMAIEGPRYRTAIQALSDELLLDQLPMAPSKGATGENAGALLASLVTHSGGSALVTHELSLNAPVSNFVPEPGAPWSKSAGQAASMARAAYRALNGALTLASLPTTVHPLNETDGSLNLAALALTSGTKRALANDVTVCGEHEPTAYVTEYFLGDGVTTQFYLVADPFFPASSETNIIRELFNQPLINESVWGVGGAGGSFTAGPGGLTIAGGNGFDGQTLISWIDKVEMGGTLLLEAVGVTLAATSSGTLAGFFVGMNMQSSCIAGFQATPLQGTGAVVLQPLVQGNAVGTTYTTNSAYQYTLRVRVHCQENERGLAIYRSFGDSGAITGGGQGSAISGRVQMEVQEFIGGVGGMPVTLYDGTIAALPQACNVIPVSCIDMIGTMRAFYLTNLGSGWVVSTPPSGGAYTRRVGTPPRLLNAICCAPASWCSTPGIRRWLVSRLQ